MNFADVGIPRPVDGVRRRRCRRALSLINVVTPAPWRENFRDGLPVTVWFHGQRQDLTGVLDDDPNRVAVALQSLADRRGSLRSVGVDIPAGHRVTVADVAAVDRAVIRFKPV